MTERVVITGRGLLCPLGDAPGAVHTALCEGRSGLGGVELFDAAGLSRPLAGEIKGFDAKAYLGKKGMRPLDRTARLVATTAHLALEDAGWTAEARSGKYLGLVLGTMYGSVRTIAEFDRRAVEAGPIYVSPLDFANTVINAAAGQTAIRHGLAGVNSTIATGQTSGLRAIAYAADFIASGRAEVLLAGGAEELCLESFLALERAGLVSTDASLEPVPFAADGSGFLPGEGTGLLVLESARVAEARGARVLGEIRGHGVAFDPTRGADEARSVAATAAAVRAALTASGVSPDELGAVSASANGSATDGREASGLAQALGDTSKRLPIAAIKGCLGDSLGADGGLQAVVALESILSGRHPGVRGFTPDAGFPFALAGSEPRPLEAPAVLLDSAGWDGQRCALILSGPAPS